MIGRPRGSGTTPLRVRFLEKIRFRSNGCWEWVGATTPKSNEYLYGMIWNGERREGAHRVAHRLFRTALPAGYVPDHCVCRNTLCVNPWHTEVVTHRENTLRGGGPPADNLLKTHCPAGHPYDAANTYHFRGARQCLTCRNTYRARRRVQEAHV